MSRPLAVFTTGRGNPPPVGRVAVFAAGCQPEGWTGRLSDDGSYLMIDLDHPRGVFVPAIPPRSDVVSAPRPEVPASPPRRIGAVEVRAALDQAGKIFREDGPVGVEHFYRDRLDQWTKDRLGHAIDREMGSRWGWIFRPPERFAQFVEQRQVASRLDDDEKMTVHNLDGQDDAGLIMAVNLDLP